MNNQVKLMDEEKFLKWMDSEDAAVLWEGPEGLMKYQLVVETINDGEFAPDTPPVPTIKPGDKVRHDDWGDGAVYALDQDDSALAIVDFDEEGLMSIHCDELEVVE